MKKRTLEDWMGETWAVIPVKPEDPRLPDNSHACFSDAHKHILVTTTHPDSITMCLMHEVAHKALKNLEFTDSEKEEIIMDHVALTYIQFLEKMGVDLGPLVE